MIWIYRTILILAFAACAYSQCVVPPGFVCLTQAQADKASTLVDKYTALQEALDASKRSIAALAVSNSTKDALIAKFKEIILIDDQTAAAKDKLLAIRDQIDAIKDDLIKNLEKKIANNKSFLQKLLTKLQIAYYILAGVAIVAK